MQSESALVQEGQETETAQILLSIFRCIMGVMEIPTGPMNCVA
jgi:hypothetical protein